MRSKMDFFIIAPWGQFFQILIDLSQHKLSKKSIRVQNSAIASHFCENIDFYRYLSIFSYLTIKKIHLKIFYLISILFLILKHIRTKRLNKNSLSYGIFTFSFSLIFTQILHFNGHRLQIFTLISSSLYYVNIRLFYFSKNI